ncbi:hypothetical protein [Ramlibacter tataouinensis]|uniref:Uncharacterized protein n=1 Tax=Ramlibacter tataouinensis (strain ATCC BAA-407 / DSM 14655 / LMG 21543 / TTB310) TaxID=365046 RepID=F5Y0C2_RAMTT|nr:hypothetical protein [Ramlibacter tataouinensis]AEG92144.1 hypothetical protein Rta_10590 [Ramlibacter tataouinensis TTB310]
MFRKLVLFAITSGLAKKAWDAYQQKNAMASSGSSPSGGRMSAGGASRRTAMRAPRAESKPDAS